MRGEPQQEPQQEQVVVLVAILMAILLLWECLELEGAAAYQGEVEHRVREDGVLADAVVSYMLPSDWRKGLVDRIIGRSLEILIAIVRVLHKSLNVEISLSQQGVKVEHQNGNILLFTGCDRDRY